MGQTVKEIITEILDTYHPFDLLKVKAMHSAEMAKLLEGIQESYMPVDLYATHIVYVRLERLLLHRIELSLDMTTLRQRKYKPVSAKKIRSTLKNLYGSINQIPVEDLELHFDVLDMQETFAGDEPSVSPWSGTPIHLFSVKNLRQMLEINKSILSERIEKGENSGGSVDSDSVMDYFLKAKAAIEHEISAKEHSGGKELQVKSLPVDDLRLWLVHNLWPRDENRFAPDGEFWDADEDLPF